MPYIILHSMSNVKRKLVKHLDFNELLQNHETQQKPLIWCINYHGLFLYSVKFQESHSTVPCIELWFRTTRHKFKVTSSALSKSQSRHDRNQSVQLIPHATIMPRVACTSSVPSLRDRNNSVRSPRYSLASNKLFPAH